MTLHHIPPEAIKQRNNDEAWIGFLLSPIGAVIGYFIGANRIKKEQTEGKTLSDDMSLLNRGAFAGAGKGMLMGSLIAVAAVVVSAATILTAPVLSAGVMLMAAILPLTSTIIGFSQGGASYNQTKAQELQAAYAIEEQQQHMAQLRSRTPELARGYAAQPEQQPNQPPQSNFVATELKRAQERQQSLAQATTEGRSI